MVLGERGGDQGSSLATSLETSARSNRSPAGNSEEEAEKGPAEIVVIPVFI